MDSKYNETIPLHGIPVQEKKLEDREKPHNIKVIIAFGILMALPIWYFIGRLVAMMFNITYYKISIVNITIAIILGIIFTMTPLVICGLGYYFYHKYKYGINLDTGKIAFYDEI